MTSDLIPPLRHSLHPAHIVVSGERAKSGASNGNAPWSCTCPFLIFYSGLRRSGWSHNSNTHLVDWQSMRDRRSSMWSSKINLYAIIGVSEEVRMTADRTPNHERWFS